MHYQQLPVTAAIAIRQCTDFAPEHHEQWLFLATLNAVG
jgi:hypothetical protein